MELEISNLLDALTQHYVDRLSIWELEPEPG